MLRTKQFTATVSAAREELVSETAGVARLRTVEVRDAQGNTVRQIKAADDDADVRTKLAAAGYTVTSWAGGTADATVTRKPGCLTYGCAGVVAFLLLSALVIGGSWFASRPDPAQFSSADAIEACHQRVADETTRGASVFFMGKDGVSGGGLDWTVAGVARAKDAAGNVVSERRYTCDLTFTSKQKNFKADVSFSPN